ncbi:MAG: hypothetical protein DMF72_15230 [Acidobacteria bacterium]|nr:MAG: hypothetical protein DMF72_15230 [Acidobacteriota bacterium]
MKKARKHVKPLTDDNREYVAQVHDRTRKHVERYSKALVNRNAADADDVTQETYARFSERVGKYGPLESDRPEKPYLLTTAKNAKSNLNRKNKLPVTTLQSDQEEMGDAHQDREASRVAGERAFREYAAATRRSTYLDRFKELIPIVQSQLTADEWQLILLRWVEGMPFDEIAIVTGQPLDQVKYRVSRATQRAKYYAGKLLSRQRTE